jgi:hypothetical protein
MPRLFSHLVFSHHRSPEPVRQHVRNLRLRQEAPSPDLGSALAGDTGGLLDAVEN